MLSFEIIAQFRLYLSKYYPILVKKLIVFRCEKQISHNTDCNNRCISRNKYFCACTDPALHL